MSILDFLLGRSDRKYELVEYPLDKETFRQGIRLLSASYRNIIVTIDPKVSVKDEDGVLKVQFDFTVECNPHNISYNRSELHRHIGDIIVELMRNDYANGKENN